jgi:hypothetical protein
MTYDDITNAVAFEGFFTHYREDNDTLICSSSAWPNVPQEAHSFWVARRGEGWYLGTWAPHVYRFGDASSVPALCIAWLHQHATCAGDVDESMRREFQLSEIDAEDLPAV